MLPSPILWTDDVKRVMGCCCLISIVFIEKKTLLLGFCSILEVGLSLDLNVLTKPGDRLPNPVVCICTFRERRLLSHGFKGIYNFAGAVA